MKLGVGTERKLSNHARNARNNCLTTSPSTFYVFSLEGTKKHLEKVMGSPKCVIPFVAPVSLS